MELLQHNNIEMKSLLTSLNWFKSRTSGLFNSLQKIQTLSLSNNSKCSSSLLLCSSLKSCSLLLHQWATRIFRQFKQVLLSQVSLNALEPATDVSTFTHCNYYKLMSFDTNSRELYFFVHFKGFKRAVNCTDWTKTCDHGDWGIPKPHWPTHANNEIEPTNGSEIFISN